MPLTIEMDNRVSRILIASLAISVGLYPIAYALVDWPFGLLHTKDKLLLETVWWQVAFINHIGFGGVALLVGWANFVDGWRLRHPKWHKLIGMLYVLSVLVSGLSGLMVGYCATGGRWAAAGFMTLAVIWLITTLRAWWSIKNGLVDAHKKAMLYSYACTFAAVTLRIYLPVLASIFDAFEPAYRVVAWLCWVPNVIWARWYTRRATL